MNEIENKYDWRKTRVKEKWDNVIKLFEWKGLRNIFIKKEKECKKGIKGIKRKKN